MPTFTFSTDVAKTYWGPYNNWSWWITATVELERLAEGDEIVITYGDTSFNEKGAFVQPWVEKDRIWFTAFVDSVGGGSFVEVPGSPVDCSVIPGPTDKCIVTVPSTINPKEQFDIKLSLTDAGLDPVEQVDVTDSQVFDRSGTPINCSSLFQNGPLDRICKVDSDRHGPFTIEIKTPEGKTIQGRSNPTVARNDQLKLYWGDLHCHSFYHQYNQKLGYGDPCTNPAELLEYARDVTHLDFVALTDGRGALPDNAGWQESQQAVIDNYVEGQFVPLKGWEIQFGDDGHRNAIYRDAQLEPHITDPAFSQASVWDQPGKFGMQAALDYYRGRDDVLLIPHHSMVWMNWDRYDENLDRLVEIYSCWGSSEYEKNDLWTKTSPPQQSVAYALSKGYKLGFVGGSDSHTGYVGRSISNADRYRFCSYKAGYTAVYAETLTREAVFDALRNRRCYATTGARMIIDFSVDGHFMGTVNNNTTPKSEHKVKWAIVGTDRISKLEIIRNGQTVNTLTPYTDICEDEWTDHSPEAEDSLYYYLRVTQVDGNTGWASPVWIR